MVHASSSSQKSPAVRRRVDTVELLQLAQMFLNVRLETHQASLLSDLIVAASDPRDDSDANAPSATSPGPSATPASSGVSAPPAYATQPATAAAPASISSPVPGPLGTAAVQVSPAPAPATIPVTVVQAAQPAASTTVAAPVAPANVVAASTSVAATTAAVNVAPPANHGFAPYQVLPAHYPYERPAYGTPGPYYAITRGRVVGVVAGWDKASPFCIGIGGAVFRSVPSIEAGKQVVEAALAAGSCMILP
ncbi:hypothetical protein BDZ89DRAFT_1142300 [Hymenopellis radicata]|nr:hypothetical protein BDZ89DRAFT_1142300 [Hymenopellis radicata]